MTAIERRWPILVGLAVALIVFDPLLTGPVSPPLLVHHIEHSLILLLAGLLGIAYARSHPRRYGDPTALLGVILLASLSVLLMLPDIYSGVDAYPILHALLHLGFALTGYFGGYLAERYSPRAGTVWTMLVVMMGVITASGFGSPPPHL